MSAQDDLKEYTRLMRNIPDIAFCTGMTLDAVKSAVDDAHTVVREYDSSSIALRQWRDWYGLYTQMLSDGYDICPENYRWEPTTLTC